MRSNQNQKPVKTETTLIFLPNIYFYLTIQATMKIEWYIEVDSFHVQVEFPSYVQILELKVVPSTDSRFDSSAQSFKLRSLIRPCHQLWPQHQPRRWKPSYNTTHTSEPAQLPSILFCFDATRHMKTLFVNKKTLINSSRWVMGYIEDCHYRMWKNMLL
jgi:hypothetical protein